MLNRKTESPGAIERLTEVVIFQAALFISTLYGFADVDVRLQFTQNEHVLWGFGFVKNLTDV